MNNLRLLLFSCLTLSLQLLSLTPEQHNEITAFLKTSPTTWNRDTANNYLKEINKDLATASVKEKIKLTNYTTQLNAGLASHSMQKQTQSSKDTNKPKITPTTKTTQATYTIKPTPSTQSVKTHSHKKISAPPTKPLPTFPVEKLTSDLVQALTEEPLNTVHIRSILKSLGDVSQKNKLSLETLNLIAMAQDMLEPQPTPDLTEQQPSAELESDAQALHVQIETTPLTFDQYVHIKKAIENLSETYHKTAETAQKNLSNELEKAFALKLPEIETRSLLASIKDWTPDLTYELRTHIINTFAGAAHKNLREELLKELAKASKKVSSPAAQIPAQQPALIDKDILTARTISLTLDSDQQAFASIIHDLLTLPLPHHIPVAIQQKVDRQIAADCGYHALKNTLAIALKRQPAELTQRLLPLWKDIITNRRAANPAAAPQQGPDWLEWAEIDFLFNEDPLGLLKNNFAAALNTITLTISEDPFNMWHEFISFRDAAQRCAQNRSCTHLIVIGTGNQQEITSAEKPTEMTWLEWTTKKISDFVATKPITPKVSLYSHWFSLVVKQENNKRTYIVADSSFPEDVDLWNRTNDPRVLRIIRLFESLIHLYS